MLDQSDLDEAIQNLETLLGDLKKFKIPKITIHDYDGETYYAYDLKEDVESDMANEGRTDYLLNTDCAYPTLEALLLDRIEDGLDDDEEDPLNNGFDIYEFKITKRYRLEGKPSELLKKHKEGLLP